MSDGASPSLRSANLSALKKRWEQAGNLNQAKPSPVSSSSHSRPPALSRPAPVPQGGDLTACEDQKPLAAPKPSLSEERREMDRDEMSQSEKPGKLEEPAPTSPRACYEKPRVPLNNLKMKFEKGEDIISKVFM